MPTELETATERVRQQGGFKSGSGSNSSRKHRGQQPPIEGKQQIHLCLHSTTQIKKKLKIDNKNLKIKILALNG